MYKNLQNVNLPMYYRGTRITPSTEITLKWCHFEAKNTDAEAGFTLLFPERRGMHTH